jgi:hypothetical protein
MMPARDDKTQHNDDGTRDVGKASLLPRLDEWRTKLETQRAKRREEVLATLKDERGNISAAATALKLSRQRLTVLLKEMQLIELARSLRRKRG